MPKCVVKDCPHGTGMKSEFPDVVLHHFPRDIDAIKRWLTAGGLDEESMESAVLEIFNDRRGDRFRICSTHFTAESYRKGCKRKLWPHATPTLMPENTTMKDRKSQELTKTSTGLPKHCFCSCHSYRKSYVDASSQTDQNDFSPLAAEVSYSLAASYKDIYSDHRYDLYTPYVLDDIRSSTPNHLSAASYGDIDKDSGTSPSNDLSGASYRDIDGDPGPDLNSSCTLEDSGTSPFNHFSDLLSTITYNDIYRDHGYDAHCSGFSEDTRGSSPATYKPKYRTPGKHRYSSFFFKDAIRAIPNQVSIAGQLWNVRSPCKYSVTNIPSLQPCQNAENKEMSFNAESHPKRSSLWFSPLTDFQDLGADMHIEAPPSPVILESTVEMLTSLSETSPVDEPLITPLSDTSSIDEPIFKKRKTPSDASYAPHLSEVSDSDYADSELDASDKPSDITTGEKNVVMERKFIVFESCLDELLRKRCCTVDCCFERLTKFDKRMVGTLLKVFATCAGGHNFLLWQSQPRIQSVAVGNLLLASAIVCSGSSYTKVKEMFDLMNIKIFGSQSFSNYQIGAIFGAIDHNWLLEKERVSSIISHKPLYLIGDGQCDSPGFNAKYCVYTMMDMQTSLILDFEAVQVSQTTSSVAMEKLGFKTCVDRIREEKYDVHMIGTDSHPGIKKIMRTDYSDINHQFDLWHYSKSIKKKLLNASRPAGCEIIKDWISPILNHFYWCSRTCKGNIEVFRDRWHGVLNHVCNIHQWKNGDVESGCKHGELTGDDVSRPWLSKPSLAYIALRDVILCPQMDRDLKHLVFYCRTGALESFHSLVLKYRTKQHHYPMNSMEARTKLAILSNNRNTNRPQAVLKTSTSAPAGTPITKLVYSRLQKKWYVRKIYEPTNNEHVKTIMMDVVNVAKGLLKPVWQSKVDKLPKNVATVKKPDKSTAIAQHRSRF
ncbi:uncharacterized protein [Hyperolius riggenbachi]|uniref:uncharacterized protein n=1 Tax=Hyperolius riggenbachi TaxID=752182 RepID=UPI0035A29AA3